MPHLKKKLPSFALIGAILALFLWQGRGAWLSRRMVVSLDLKVPAPFVCQVFYTESEGQELELEKSARAMVKPGGAHVVFALPIRRLERLRITLGNKPGKVRASRVVVRGTETRVLDWNDFGLRRGISRFDIDAKGAVDIVETGASPLGIRGRLHVNVFVFSFLAVLGLLSGSAFSRIPGAVRRFAEIPRGERLQKAVFLLAAIALVVARMALTAGLPPRFYASSWDDLLFVRNGLSIVHGNWLGPYDQHTLAKGCFGPMFLAVSILAGLPFLVTETLLYVAGCVFFVWVLSRLVPNRPFLLAAFALLLFNPVSFSSSTWQRIYRNGMALWQVPLVVGCLLQMYRSCHSPIRRWLKWAVLSGLALWAFLNTREDGVWIWPFALTCMALSAAKATAAESSRMRRIVRACSCALPIAVIMFGNAILCLVNWNWYGLPMRNDRDAGNYAMAMKDLYLIAPDPEDDARLSSPEHAGHYHNIYYSTLRKAYDASPTLNGARQKIDAVIEAWSHYPYQHGRDLCFDHMLFAIRNGVSLAGHYGSLRDGEEFFGAVHNELSRAFADGRLVRRGTSVTAMAAPFRLEQIPKIAREWVDALAGLTVFWKNPGRPRPEWVDPSDQNGRGFVKPAIVSVLEAASGGKVPGKDEIGTVRPKLSRATNVADAYVSAVPWAVVAALVVYVALSVLAASRPRLRSRISSEWLLATGLLGSILVHSACIAYISATTFYATGYFYMAASCQMVLMFIVVVAGMVFKAAGKGSCRQVNENSLT